MIILMAIVFFVGLGFGFTIGELSATAKNTVALTKPMIEKILRKHRDKDGEFFFGPCAEEIEKRLTIKK